MIQNTWFFLALPSAGIHCNHERPLIGMAFNVLINLFFVFTNPEKDLYRSVCLPHSCRKNWACSANLELPILATNCPNSLRLIHGKLKMSTQTSSGNPYTICQRSICLCLTLKYLQKTSQSYKCEKISSFVEYKYFFPQVMANVLVFMQ